MQVTTIASYFSIWIIVKLFFIIGLLVYSVFALVVIRQTQIMTNTVKLDFEAPIYALSVIHFLFAIGVLIFAIFIL